MIVFIRAVLLIALVSALGLGSCSKTCFCNTATLSLNYVSFDPAETDTIVLRRYTKNSQFASLLDTATLNARNAVFSFRKDTMSVHSDTVGLQLYSYYDYILYLPALNRRDSLSGIYESHETQEGGRDLECTCVNRILSFYLNRDTLKVSNPALPQLYIHR